MSVQMPITDSATPWDLYHRATSLRKVAIDEAISTFEALIEGRHGPVAAALLLKTYRRAFKCLALVQQWDRMEVIARRALVDFPEASPSYQALGEALIGQGRTTEAEAALQAAIRLDPECTEPRNLLRLINTSSPPSRPPSMVRPWPSAQRPFANPRKVLERYVLRGRPEDRFIRPGSAFLTMGSCFAENLARRLAASGHVSAYEAIGEDVNSTFANRCMLHWLEHGVVDEPTASMQEVYGSDCRERLRQAIIKSDIFVLSLGVAASFFHRVTGEFAFIAGNVSQLARERLMAEYKMRTTTVAENVENIHGILDAIARIAGRRSRVVLTVSPVALEATNEFESAPVADCLSKSTLRLACQEVLTARSGEGVIYWPSFEMVRWLGPHYGPGVPLAFGANDGNTHHVSSWLVELVVNLFLEHHSVQLEASA